MAIDPIDDGFLSHGPPRDGNMLVSRDRVALWWLATDRVPPDGWSALSGLLSDAERARAQRFHFERDRHSYILAHALCRGLLSACTARAPGSFSFEPGDHGKPEVAVLPGEGRLRVNISHTRGMAAAALTVDHDIGVDVEWLGRNVGASAVAASHFAPSEQAVLAAAPEAQKTETFLAFWTLKEAYVKAIGKGLSQPLQSFAFDLKTRAIRFDDALCDDPACWRFARLAPGRDHTLALAVRHPQPASLEICGGPAQLDQLLALAGGQISRK
jgi:4'-phosphopantetheinyl transferase